MLNAALVIGMPMSLLLKVGEKNLLSHSIMQSMHPHNFSSLFTVASLLWAIVTIYAIYLFLLASLGDNEVV